MYHSVQRIARRGIGFGMVLIFLPDVVGASCRRRSCPCSSSLAPLASSLWTTESLSSFYSFQCQNGSFPSGFSKTRPHSPSSAAESKNSAAGKSYLYSLTCPFTCGEATYDMLMSSEVQQLFISTIATSILLVAMFCYASFPNCQVITMKEQPS